MLYCENCKQLCADEACPDCGIKLLREAEPQDFCFLSEEEEGFARMLEGSFQEEAIPCVLLPWGNGTRSAFGLSLGRFRIYVPFAHYEQASSMLEFFEEEPADHDLRKDLMEHRSLWNFDPKMEKKIRKKLNVAEGQQVLDRVCDVLSAATDLNIGGRIYTCPRGGCHILVKADGVKFWFNSVTYEVFL